MLSSPSQLRPLLQTAELSTLMQLGPGPGSYLVGGAVRNALCGDPVHDFDLATAYDPTALAQALAVALNGHWFWLDSSRRQSRVVLTTGSCVDFAPLRGVDLTADLRERDFTINAIALDLSPAEQRLIDPLNGLGDLQARQLRCCSNSVLLSDPIRVLRGCRFVGCYGFEPLPETRRLLQQAARLLANTAGERVRNELGMLLQIPAPGPGLQLMSELGLLHGPVAALHKQWQSWREVLHHTGAHGPRLSGLLKEVVADQLDRMTLLRLAGLQPLLPVGLPLTLSRRNGKLLLLLQRLFTDPPQWSGYWQVGKRARLRRLEDWAPDPPLLLIGHWLIGDASPVDLPLLTELLELCREIADNKLPGLLTGADLQTALALEPGPGLGELLAQLRRAEWQGLVETREQGLAYLRRNGQKDVDKG